MSLNPLLPSQELSSAILSPLRTVITWTLMLVMAVLAFWCLCITLYFTSWQHATAPLEQLYYETGENFAQGAPFSHLTGIASTLSTSLHHGLFTVTGIEASLQTSSGTVSSFERAVQTLLNLLVPSLQVVILATQVLSLRFALLIGMLPLVALLYSLAFIDGAAERSVRRACAGRESANLYHRAKYFQFALFGAWLMVSLCSPVHIPPTWTLLFFAVAVGLNARLQWAYYKKYM